MSTQPNHQIKSQDLSRLLIGTKLVMASDSSSDSTHLHDYRRFIGIEGERKSTLANVSSIAKCVNDRPNPTREDSHTTDIIVGGKILDIWNLFNNAPELWR